MFWKHFGIHFGAQILPKSIQNRAETIKNRAREAFLAPGVCRRRSMSALGVLGGIPECILGWFWGPESIQNWWKFDIEKRLVVRNAFWVILGGFWCHLGLEIGTFRKPFLKTRKFENPSKTIVFPMYSMCCARTARCWGGRRSVSECKNGFHAELTHYVQKDRSARRPSTPKRRPRSVPDGFPW